MKHKQAAGQAPGCCCNTEQQHQLPRHPPFRLQPPTRPYTTPRAGQCQASRRPHTAEAASTAAGQVPTRRSCPVQDTRRHRPPHNRPCQAPTTLSPLPTPHHHRGPQPTPCSTAARGEERSPGQRHNTGRAHTSTQLAAHDTWSMYKQRSSRACGVASAPRQPAAAASPDKSCDHAKGLLVTGQDHTTTPGSTRRPCQSLGRRGAGAAAGPRLGKEPQHEGEVGQRGHSRHLNPIPVH